MRKAYIYRGDINEKGGEISKKYKETTTSQEPVTEQILRSKCIQSFIQQILLITSSCQILFCVLRTWHKTRQKSVLLL